MDSTWLVRPALICTALICTALLCATCAPAREPSTWACDRAQGELLALDRELLVVLRRPLEGARLLCADARGGWVAYGPERGPPARLARFTLAGEVEPPWTFHGIEALASGGREGAVFVLEARDGGARHLWRVGPGAARRWLAEFAGACALAARGRELLVGRAAGELVLLREDGALLCSSAAPGPVWSVAPGPREGTWWALCGDGPATLLFLGEGLCARWGSATGLATRRFAAVPSEERSWLADGHRLRCYGPDGALEQELALDESGLAPAPAAVVARDDCALLCTPGALLEVRVLGGAPVAARSQGGFAALADVVGAPP